MKILTIGLYACGLLLGVFGYWGAFTKSGGAHFDEMDGMIPFFSLLISIVLILIAIILSIVLYVKYKRAKRN